MGNSPGELWVTHRHVLLADLHLLEHHGALFHHESSLIRVRRDVILHLKTQVQMEANPSSVSGGDEGRQFFLPNKAESLRKC